MRIGLTPFRRLRNRQATGFAAAALAGASRLCVAPLAGTLRQNVARKTEQKAEHRANELTLAGLRPGRHTRTAALARYHKPWGASDEKTAAWRDLCRGREVRMEFDENDVVESITASVIAGPHYDCPAGTPVMAAETWRTGRGLALGAMRERVGALYGEPESRGPSTREGEETEFLYYPFDWAGSDVPQVLEVTCDKKSGRVVQLTLARQSL